VAGLARALPPHPGIMPLVDIAAMPSATRVQVVAAIQGLLMSWGIDPGPLDGKPGEKTLAGVQAFQRRKLLPPTGVVDANTWSEMLRP
jgi:peptidoglycan hydrolase-like protein with peptidoglycan-binding domain